MERAMSTPTDDDLDDVPEDELLAIPGEAIPAGWLTAFFTRRAEVLHQRELDELALERSGNSARHYFIFSGMDPKQRQQREDEARRRAWLAEQEMLEYRQRTDRLLAQIEEQQRVVEKRRKEIEDNAIRLHDGRRVYVDGDHYRDGQGRFLEGRDRDEAAALHRDNPEASTWEQKQEIERRAEELQRLKDKVLKDREGGEGTPEEKQQRLSGYEKELADKIASRQNAMNAVVPGGHNDSVPDYGSTDYMCSRVVATGTLTRGGRLILPLSMV
jgi:hypothetical protein